jgi:hypothetical protein
VETPAADGTQPEATVETPEATTGQQSDADNEGAASAADDTGDTPGDDAAAEPQRKKPGVHNRIDELTRQKHDALRDADYWKAKYNEASKVDIDSLDYDDQLVAKVRKAERQERAESAEVVAQRLTAEHFEAKIEEARSKWADFDIVTQNPNLPISVEMGKVIQDSEAGAEVFYHLGKNPTEAARIMRLPTHMQAAELGKLEARITAPKPLPKQPPTPVKPVNGMTAGGTKDPGKMSMAEYIAARNAGTIT